MHYNYDFSYRKKYQNYILNITNIFKIRKNRIFLYN